MSGPRTIMIIRHGEKPDKHHPEKAPFGVDEDGNQTPHGLLVRGWRRAQAISTLLTTDPVRTPFVRPDHLYAPGKADSNESFRPYETLIPVSEALDLEIHTKHREGDETELARHLAGKDGAEVLICWEHHHIPDIAAALVTALDVRQVLPPNATTWPDDDYWSVLVFSSTDGGYQLAQTSEAVLPGDPPA